MSSGSVNEITIYPLYEMFYDEKEIEKIVKRIKSKNIITEKIQRDIESIENYQNLDQLYTYLPDICEEYQPFYQLIENNICIYEDYASCLEHEKAMNVEISDYFTINKRHINKDFFVTLQQALYFARLNIFTSVFRSSLVDIKLDQHIPLNTSNCYEYNNNIRTMLEDIKLNKEKTYLITHIDDKKLKFIEETFNSNQIDFKRIDDVTEIKKGRTYISVMPNGYGFEDLEANFSIITPNEFAPGKIIKSSKYQKFLKDTTKIYNKEELNPGDYVVHQEYGIGKYLGIQTKEVRNNLNDYLCVEYSGDSKLYIPVENIYVLEKYIGSKDKLPKLNSLNSKEWQKKKEKIKEKTREIAKKLIKVQAERDSKIGFKYKEDTLEQIEFENDFEYNETQDQKRAIEDVKKIWKAHIL